MSELDSMAAARSDALKNPPQGPIAACPKQRTDWIEIVLKDSEGNPIPEQEYLVIAPGGQRYTGSLDRNGYARIEGVEPGSCDISFPQLDRREWDRK